MIETQTKRTQFIAELKKKMEAIQKPDNLEEATWAWAADEYLELHRLYVFLRKELKEL